MNIKMYRAVIFCLVLYGCETWSLTLREEHRQRLSENKVLRMACGPKVARDMEVEKTT
jgi:hypothetical protein